MTPARSLNLFPMRVSSLCINLDSWSEHLNLIKSINCTYIPLTVILPKIKTWNVWLDLGHIKYDDVQNQCNDRIGIYPFKYDSLRNLRLKRSSHLSLCLWQHLVSEKEIMDLCPYDNEKIKNLKNKMIASATNLWV